MAKKSVITLSRGEITGQHDRVSYAEGLILQLPEGHDGRNTWLLNYGQGMEAQTMRAKRGIVWCSDTESAHVPPPPFQLRT